MPKRAPIPCKIKLDLRAAAYHSAELGRTSAEERVSFGFFSCGFVELRVSLELYRCRGRCGRVKCSVVVLRGPSGAGGAARVQQPV